MQLWIPEKLVLTDKYCIWSVLNLFFRDYLHFKMDYNSVTQAYL